jgi:hypothetical protein
MTWRETPLRGWVALSANSIAVLYGVAFLVWALAVPAYEGRTFVDLSSSVGSGVLLASQSLLVSVAVWMLLHRHCTLGDERSFRFGAVLVTVFMAWAWIGGFSLSFGVFPAACLLVLAALLTPAGSSQAAPS